MPVWGIQWGCQAWGRWPWESIFSGLGWDSLHPCWVLLILLERGKRGLSSDICLHHGDKANPKFILISKLELQFHRSFHLFLHFMLLLLNFRSESEKKRGDCIELLWRKPQGAVRFKYETWILYSSLSLSECFPLCLCLVNAWSIDFLPVWTGFPASLFVLVFSTLW